jgi:hypothetical protein
MRCSGFERWLDEGRPESQAGGARAQAAACVACAASLRAALELEDLLAVPLAIPDPDLARIMERVEATRRVRPAPAPERPMLPWWIEAAAQPSVALALVLAGLLAWRAGDLETLISSAWWQAAPALAAANTWFVVGAQRVFGPAEPLLWLALLPVTVLAMVPLYRWSESVARVIAHPRRPQRGRLSPA